MALLQRAKQLYWAVRKNQIDWRAAAGDLRAQASILIRLLPHHMKLRRAPETETAESFRSSTPPEKRLLFISYYSPPYNSALGTQRLSKFIKYLSRSGWKIALVTTAPRAQWEIDKQAEVLPSTVDTIRLEQYESSVPALRGV